MANQTSDKDGLLKEYEQLRQGILHTEGSILQVLGIVLGAVGVITAQGFSSKSPYIFLIAMPLMTITSFYIADKRWGIWLVASYLKKFVESKESGLQWETRLHSFRTEFEKTKKNRWIGFLPGQNIMQIEFVLFNTIGFAHLLFFFYYARCPFISTWIFTLPSIQCQNTPSLMYLLAIFLFLLLLGITRFHYKNLLKEGREGSSLEACWKDESGGEVVSEE